MRATATLVAPSRPRLRRPFLLVVTATLVVAASYGVAATRPASRSTPAPTAAIAPPEAIAPEAANLDRIGAAIATWTANLERDPADFIAAVHLAELYLARAQLTASPTDYDRALGAVDRALETDPTLTAARLLRIRALFASHDFTGAEQAASDLLATQPALAQAHASLGDARLELGDYAGAADAYAEIADPASAPVIARQVRLEALTGSLAHARQIAADASGIAEADAATTATDRSFYRLLEGTLALQAGDAEAALASCGAAVDAWPASPAALGCLGRAQAASGDRSAAIGSLERAVAIRPEPAILATLGDLLAASGRVDEAETRYDQVRGIAAIEGDGGLFSRAVVLFLADHGESNDAAVAMAETELQTRRDVGGWDAYAWALFAAGRFAEADAAMAEARAVGTEDPSLDYHAGMIAAALGRTDQASELLHAALDRAAGLGVVQAERARAALADLETAP